MYSKSIIVPLMLLATKDVSAFQPSSIKMQKPSTFLSMTSDIESEMKDDRRTFLSRSTAAILAGISTSVTTSGPAPSNAVVYLDPAMYGDQENRASCVDSLKEAVRRAILQKPDLASSFYTLSLLDGLSFDAKSNNYGPDGRVIQAVLSSKESTPYINNLKQAAQTLVDSKKSLKKLTSITIADAVALGGTEAVEAIGGPGLSVQVGRTDFLQGQTYNPKVPIDLLEGKRNLREVSDAFKSSGLTEREMTALLGALLTIQLTEADSNVGDWMKTDKTAFVQRGKMGRMSAYKRITEEDVEAAAASEFEDDDEPGLFDDQPYIADTFGTKDQAFGKKTGNLDPKNFNKYLQAINNTFRSGPDSSLGWIGTLLTDVDLPGTRSWVSQYAGSNIKYQKDLGIAFNSMSQLGGEYTGGKYESLLKNKPRKRLNDFD